jgi:hypothetical protein
MRDVKRDRKIEGFELTPHRPLCTILDASWKASCRLVRSVAFDHEANDWFLSRSASDIPLDRLTKIEVNE